METIRITIATPPPSLNAVLRMHHMKRVRLKHRIYWEVMGEVFSRVRKEGVPLFGGAPVKISGTRYAKLPLDPDNLIGSLKPVIDGLRHCGAILDDTADLVTFGEFKQLRVKRGELPRLELEIERNPL